MAEVFFVGKTFAERVYVHIIGGSRCVQSQITARVKALSDRILKHRHKIAKRVDLVGLDLYVEKAERGWRTHYVAKISGTLCNIRICAEQVGVISNMKLALERASDRIMVKLSETKEVYRKHFKVGGDVGFTWRGEVPENRTQLDRLVSSPAQYLHENIKNLCSVDVNITAYGEKYTCYFIVKYTDDVGNVEETCSPEITTEELKTALIGAAESLVLLEIPFWARQDPEVTNLVSQVERGFHIIFPEEER